MGGVGMGRMMGEQGETQEEERPTAPREAGGTEAQGHRGVRELGERAQGCPSTERHRETERHRKAAGKWMAEQRLRARPVIASRVTRMPCSPTALPAKDSDRGSRALLSQAVQPCHRLPQRHCHWAGALVGRLDLPSLPLYLNVTDPGVPPWLGRVPSSAGNWHPTYYQIAARALGLALRTSKLAKSARPHLGGGREVLSTSRHTWSTKCHLRPHFTGQGFAKRAPLVTHSTNTYPSPPVCQAWEGVGTRPPGSALPPPPPRLHAPGAQGLACLSSILKVPPPCFHS